ncbi:RICIN domain-containing protein [Streptomyces graminilatus]|uniref:RICIN domain-containing protein n=1 Tax=Streptomyces graminilatus TaxID=1464070 RepID=UPI001F5253B0|nr:RICIN domain-containing protein [Streptomyces graminilatus]
MTSVAALAVLVGLAVQPSLLGRDAAQPAAAAADSYDGFDIKAAEQLREDQCVAVEALRKGGASMFALAQNAIGLPADQLHQKLRRDPFSTDTPLYQAEVSDSASSTQGRDKVFAEEFALTGAVTGLSSFPGEPDDRFKIFEQAGLYAWVWQSYNVGNGLFSPFYEASPTADDETKAAALTIGDPLYTTGGTPEEQQAWKLWKKNSGKIEPNVLFVPRVFADDARIFLASGGFPHTAPDPDTPEFRIAVEDLKARFASCSWHAPIDPNRVLGKEVAQASAEWQQEIAAQVTQRQQILAASRDAANALRDGSFALGRILGQSWLADFATRWQDYWSAGGVGWIGDSYVTIEVPGARGNCLDVQGSGQTNGTPVQIYTCNGAGSQKWTLEGGEDNLHLRSVLSGKCLTVAGNAAANGTKIQTWDCDSSAGQSWKGDVRAAAPLKNVTTGKCLDLSAFTKGTDARLWDCKDVSTQKFLIKPSGHEGTRWSQYPDKAEFDKAKKVVADAQVAAKKQLALIRPQLEKAKKAAAASDAAEQAAYGIADAAGAPRGRGLLVGQQKAQVTKATVAALMATLKAGETAEAATRAAAGDSATITQRAQAQAAQVSAEFRKEAAHAAELQAKAAADAAKLHRDNARKDKETAEAKLATALKAEADAKAAAADARAKRLAAEAEEKTAKAEKDTATAKQIEANRHKQTAQAEAANARDAKERAEAAEGTAVARKNDAVKARDEARDLRDDAWDAEQKADASRAKADAKEAFAQAHESDSNARESRAAADAASAHADDAEAAAGRSRTAADAATRAAAEADAAATRAEAAAGRARSNADAAQAAKLRADAAVATATSEVADAITASEHASSEAQSAVRLADEAETLARTAMSQADEANKEAAKALAASAKAAGFAHVTAQAAVDAGNAAVQVAKPANDAIELGSPYVTTDSAADLVVLAGQSAKSIAEQQQAVADAHAKNAQAEAAAAKKLADQAAGDTKAAYQYAANAAAHAANARTYSKDALGYAADAAQAASRASASLARTIEYDHQATADATAADQSAGRAEGYARDARASADQAALDASAARDAAATAEQSAKDARAAANRADAAATEAEQAAKDADRYAKEAQEIARRTGIKNRNDQIEAGAAGVGGVFFKTRVEPVGEPEILHKENCNVFAHIGDCVITANITAKTFVDIYLCTAKDIPDVQSGCPASETLFIDSVGLKPETKEVTYAITPQEFNDAVSKGFVKALTEDFVGCWDRITTGSGGTLGNCGWALFDVALVVFGNVAIKAIKDAVTALDAAMRTGIAIDEAWKALRAAGVSEAAVEGITSKLALTKCFPAGTKVATEHGPKSIEDIKVGDRVWSQDQVTGKKSLQPVLNLFHHTVDSLVRINTADGQVEATDSHRFWVRERGWVEAGELRAGDTLEGRDGGSDQVLGTTVVNGSIEVFNFEVARNHTYYVYAGSTPVLVHNECLQGILNELVKEGDHIVLGINPYSDRLAEETLGGTRALSGPGARTFNNRLLGKPAPNGDGRPIWMEGVEKTLDNESVKLSVSLDGVANAKTPAEALDKLVERGKPLVSGDWQTVAMPGSNNGTAWEMATLRLKVLLGRRDFEAVDWYFTKPGDKVPSLVTDMPKPKWAQ